VRQENLWTLLLLFIVQSASAFNCDKIQHYHKVQTQVRGSLTNEINRVNKLIEIELRTQQTIWVPKGEKAKRQEHLLKRSGERLNTAKELLTRVQILISNQITDQAVLAEVNESLKQNLLSSPETALALQLENILHSYRSSLKPQTFLALQELAKLLNQNQKLAQAWTVEHINILSEVALNKRPTLEVILEGTFRFIQQTDDHLAELNHSKKGLQLEQIETNQEIERSNRRIEEHKKQIAGLQMRIENSKNEDLAIDQRAVSCRPGTRLDDRNWSISQ